jgi:hypothetical protein
VKTLSKGSRRAWVDERTSAPERAETMPNGVTGASVLASDGRTAMLETVSDESIRVPAGDGSSEETGSISSIGVSLSVCAKRFTVLGCEISLISVGNGSRKVWVDDDIPTSDSSETVLGITRVPETDGDGRIAVLDSV